MKRFMRFIAPAVALLAAISLTSGTATTPAVVKAQARSAQDNKYAAAIDSLESMIRAEMADKQLPALSIALVDDQHIVWAKGFGYQDPDNKIAATAQTVYRVGSVSKLFTDIAVMQLVEQGKLDLNAPVSTYIPEFHPENPFDKPITLRELMSHRSGLVREPPAGHYFDPTEPSLEQTVLSLNRTRLVYQPGTHTKYSNAGVATVGYVLQRVTGHPFAEYVKKAVLEPLGMKDSAFRPEPALAKNLAKAYMWSYDGRTFEAPKFQLGMAPAGSMYSTVTDLGRFLSALFAEGRARGGQIVKPETLRQMWTPQFQANGKTGYGIGFGISELDGHRRIGHGGAIYGFATILSGLPEEKLGVVAVTTVDGANAVVNHISQQALQLMLATRENKPLPEIKMTAPVPVEDAGRLEGRYSDGSTMIELTKENGHLYLSDLAGGERTEIKRQGDSLITDGRLGYGSHITTTDDGIEWNGKKLRRDSGANLKP
ncbi:MAG: serine hydrolase domain-containing protein, partial [Blastocatellia bacterium]